MYRRRICSLCIRLWRMRDRGGACHGRDFCRGRGNFPVPFRWLSVCQVSLDKKHIGLEDIAGIHRAIQMNCAAQAGLNSASEAEFSLLIRCGFYQVILRRSLCPQKVSPKFPPAAAPPPLTGWVHPVGRWGYLPGRKRLDGSSGSEWPGGYLPHLVPAFIQHRSAPGSTQQYSA